jgi:hypothetical protein
MFSKRQKQFLERKTCCSLSKKNSHYTNERAENQIINNQAIITQSTLSMKAKNKEQTNESSQCKQKCSFKPISK